MNKFFIGVGIVFFGFYLAWLFIMHQRKFPQRLDFVLLTYATLIMAAFFIAMGI